MTTTDSVIHALQERDADAIATLLNVAEDDVALLMRDADTDDIPEADDFADAYARVVDALCATGSTETEAFNLCDIIAGVVPLPHSRVQ
jgi:hypothetical protein